MTFSMGTTPAAGGAGGDRLEDRPEAAERHALDVAERGEHGVLGERAGLAGIGDGSGWSWRGVSPASLAGRPGGRACAYWLNQSVVSICAGVLVELGALLARGPAADRRLLAGARARRGRRLRGARQCASASIALSATM